LDVIHDETHMPRGAIDSLGISEKAEKTMYFTRNDWPTHEGAAISKMDLDTGSITPILESAGGYKLFARMQHSADSEYLFAADSYNKQLLKIEAATGSVEDSHSLSSVLGPVKGMVSPLDAVESIVEIK